ncbi:SIMPL domain-containing protein [Caloramator australicus]|uniref:Uncharacterized protein n=1 Tax=Caloramator australicus RC3 TaxID=857293 RepID=I7K7T7_9CLOT|nr:SIMPL domain-containing protein [Caloramator australicus]CCJ33599.1 hypothetical protein CAAU_1515 [Caloramator australicus RC3]
MEVTRVIVIQLKPTKEQKIILRHLTYSASKLWNVANYNIKQGNIKPKELKPTLKENFWYKNLHSQYYYTKIADLKVDMLGLATKDAMQRAEQIAKNTGIKIGKLKSAKMGVFQITAPYSTEVSDYGIFDTMSINKEITAVVNCEFEIKD